MWKVFSMLLLVTGGIVVANHDIVVMLGVYMFVWGNTLLFAELTNN